jgi:uncharacterized protein YceH (UPF0502 family)
MTTPPADHTRAAPPWKPLEANQRRVLGVLVEKAKTTPSAHPMTVNAIVTGCNQKNNRDPLTAMDDFDVEKALGELCALGAVSEIDWLGRVPKYKHHAYEWLGVSRVEAAVMAELLLRGAQALGDLRVRAARMEPIADLAALKPIVDALVERGLMVELTPAGRGQVVSHALYLPQELAELKAHHAGHASRTGAPEPAEPASRVVAATRANPVTATDDPAHAGTDDTLAGLASGLAELRAEVARLRVKIGELESRLAAAGG